MDKNVIKRSESFRKILAKRSIEYLKENGVFVCEKCFGSGLGGISKLGGNEGYCWDLQSYCETCLGIGYIGINEKILKIDDTTWYCEKCIGEGCKRCNYIGKVDWISRITGV